MTMADVLARLEGVRTCAVGWTAKCPAHPDKQNSLSIGIGSNGRLLLKCFAGCGFERIMAALGAPRVTRSDAALPAVPSNDEELERRRRIDCARSIWNSAFPIAGPPVEKYARG